MSAEHPLKNAFRGMQREIINEKRNRDQAQRDARAFAETAWETALVVVQQIILPTLDGIKVNAVENDHWDQNYGRAEITTSDKLDYPELLEVRFQLSPDGTEFIESGEARYVINAPWQTFDFYVAGRGPYPKPVKDFTKQTVSDDILSLIAGYKLPPVEAEVEHW